MIVDTSALLAYFDRNEPDHAAVAGTMESATDPLVVSPFVVAELDYLIMTRLGTAAELAALDELAGGAWELASVSADDLAVCTRVIEKYADQSIGVTDASLVVLAQRFATRSIATLDRRHFDVLRPLDGGRFRLVP